MTIDFARQLVDDLKDEYTSVVSDGQGSAEFSSYIDTGCYMLNAVISGSIFGGMPDNKTLGLAGETTTGKTFFALSIVKHFLDMNEKNVVVYYDTEAAVTKEMMEHRGIDTKRVILAEPATIQDFRTHALKVLESYSKVKEKDRPKMLVVLDSLGMLSTTKEMEDTAAGKETRDMTRAQIIRATFRVLTLKMAALKVPRIITNHVYAAVGSYFPTNEISGGGGFKFAADIILTLSKKKEREGTEVVGNIIKTKTYKSRLSKENKDTELLLSYRTGLDKYYGLLQFAEKHGMVHKDGRSYVFPNGEKYTKKKLDDSPEEVFTQSFLEELDQVIQGEYKYGE